jgi:splicing factor 3B subunit 3
MHLLHFTQHQPSAITHAVYGSFTKPVTHELVLARGRLLELFSMTSEGALERVARVNCFAHVRGIATLRLAGQSKDIIVVTSDSGRLTFMSLVGGQFKREACETYGSWGALVVAGGGDMS